jgi:hypothetical protein
MYEKSFSTIKVKKKRSDNCCESVSLGNPEVGHCGQSVAVVGLNLTRRLAIWQRLATMVAA